MNICLFSSAQNPAQKPGKTREKVAETAEIPKTAPKTQQNVIMSAFEEKWEKEM